MEDDDKPTVVLDLNALKKQKLKQEEDLANIAQDLEFAVAPALGLEFESHLAQSSDIAEMTGTADFRVILFDFQSSFFSKIQGSIP